jgi:hypothetical protein
MNVLIACEESGTVRDAFIAKGHNAISCDILDTSKPGPHIKGDVIKLLGMEWDLIIAHPPCTYLSNSGVCHLYNKDGSKNLDRWSSLFEAKMFFGKILGCHHVPKIAIENPIPHKYGLGKTYTQLIQPYQFGHTERKATCLWLKGLPPLVETNNVKDEMLKLPKKEQQRMHYMSPGKDRAKLRSKTYQGIADAMAEQWGQYGF